MTKHTPEPWDDDDFYADVPQEIVGMYLLGHADFARAKACVSACTGMADPARQIEAMREVVAIARKINSDGFSGELEAALKRLDGGEA